MASHPFDESFKWRALALLANIQEGRQLLQHSGLFGEDNEGLLHDTIRDYLDENWTVGSGEIIDIEGKRSPQCDVIIYNASMLPKAYKSRAGKVVVLAHAVGAVIEVKTTLHTLQGKDTSVVSICDQMQKTSTFLRNAIQIGNTRLLNRRCNSTWGEFVHKNRNHIPVIGFAYSATPLSESIQDAVSQHIMAEGSNPLLYILDVKRSAEEIKAKFSQIATNPNQSTVLDFAESLRMPNGFHFYCQEYDVTDANGNKIVKKRMLKHNLGEQTLRHFMKHVSELIHTCGPGSIQLTSTDKELLYKAYDPMYS